MLHLLKPLNEFSFEVHISIRNRIFVENKKRVKTFRYFSEQLNTIYVLYLKHFSVGKRGRDREKLILVCTLGIV